MAMTRPVGIFMLIFSVPFMVVGAIRGLRDGSSFAWGVFALGLLLLYLGMRSAWEKPENGRE